MLGDSERSPREWRRLLPGLKLPEEAPADIDLGPMCEYELHTRKARQSRHIPGCSSIAIQKDQVLQVGAFGWSDLEHGHPMGMDTIVRLYCLTKPMIATGLMMLVERGKCKLEDELSKYLPEFKGIRVCSKKGNLHCTPDDKPTERRLTLRRLLTHCSGLGYGAGLGMEPSGPEEAAYSQIPKDCDAGKIKNLAELCKRLAALPLRFQPGEKYFYSYGLDVAGRVIEVISGQRLDTFLKSEIFGPLGMRDTGFAVPPGVAKKRLAAAYSSPYDRKAMGLKPAPRSLRHKSQLGTLVRVDGDRPEQSAWVAGRHCPVFSGGGLMGMNRGGMVSTILDQMRFYLMLVRGGQLSPEAKRLLKPKTIKEMWSSDWLTSPKTVGKICRDKGKQFGWHALGEIATVKRLGTYPDVFEMGEWGMAGAAETHVTVNLRKQLLCLWFTQASEGWPGFKGPEQNLWLAANKVIAQQAKVRKVEGALSARKRRSSSAAARGATAKRARAA